MKTQATPKIVTAMADAMVEIQTRHGACTPADLYCAGFKPADIELHKDEPLAAAGKLSQARGVDLVAGV